MTFNDLVEHAVKLGYKIDQHDGYYRLVFSVDDSTEVELEIPNDKMEDLIDDSTNIEWKYLITAKLGNSKIFSDWFDYYEGSKETKIEEMQQDILEYLNSFATKKFNIFEKSVFTLFGKRFLKYKELVFE